MNLPWAQKTIAAATMAAGLLVSGANLAKAQPSEPYRPNDNPGYTGAPIEYHRGFNWGLLGLFGLFGLLGKRRLITHDKTGTTYARHDTFEPRPAR
jgi:hypothetical protein